MIKVGVIEMTMTMIMTILSKFPRIDWPVAILFFKVKTIKMTSHVTRALSQL